MLDQVTRIYDFNRVNGLLDKPYNDFLESSFQIEEALEGFDLPVIIETLDLKIDFDTNSKGVAREILSSVSNNELSDLDRLDKHLDSIVYDIGAIAKLGLTPAQLLQALSIVMDANEAKNGCPKDSFGKLMKGSSFEGPEPRLEQLLLTRVEQ